MSMESVSRISTKDAKRREASATFTLRGGLTVHRLGFGAMHLTGPGMWGDFKDPDLAVRVLRRAIDLGVDFIDTADAYGPGNNEQMIRQALHPYPKELVICTKGGLLRSGPKDWSGDGPPYIVPCGRPAYLRQQVELSLRNLGVDCIKVYQLHSIDPLVPLSDQLGELVRLREQGKIQHIGLSGQPAVKVEDVLAAQQFTEIVAVESLYNIVDRTDLTALRFAEEQGIAYIPWFPLGHGQLTRPDSPLRPLAQQFDLTPSQLALAFLLHTSKTTLLIPGTTSVRHLEENVKAAQVHLSEDDLRVITQSVDALGLETWRPTP